MKVPHAIKGFLKGFLTHILSAAIGQAERIGMAPSLLVFLKPNEKMFIVKN